MTELKPCPFCGASGMLERLGGEGSTHYIAKCSGCRCDLHFYSTREQAVSKWNQRSNRSVWFDDFRPIINAIGDISVQEAMDAIERKLR